MGAIHLMGTLRPSRTIYTTSSLQTRLCLAKMKCISNASGFNVIEKNKIVTCDGERKQAVVLTKAAACSKVALNYDVPTQTEISKVLLDVATVVVIVRIAVVQRLRMFTRYRSSWRSVVQLYIEKTMIDCRFFTMFAVGGTLLGSVLCFLEGTYLVVESYIQYFKSLSHHSDHGQVMQLLIEALDMFLVGTAMLVFGMGLHVMLVGSSHRSQLPTSNIFGNFYLKNVPSWAGVKSVTQAKSMIGYALMLLLQVGVLEKFKSVPLVTGLDLVCLAGAVFVSSAGLFILSKLNVVA